MKSRSEFTCFLLLLSGDLMEIVLKHNILLNEVSSVVRVMSDTIFILAE